MSHDREIQTDGPPEFHLEKGARGQEPVPLATPNAAVQMNEAPDGLYLHDPNAGTRFKDEIDFTERGFESMLEQTPAKALACVRGREKFRIKTLVRRRKPKRSERAKIP